MYLLLNRKAFVIKRAYKILEIYIEEHLSKAECSLSEQNGAQKSIIE